MFLGLSSCLLPSEKGKVSLNLSSKDQEARDRSKKGQASVASVSLVNDEIVITGTDLDGVTKVKVTQSGSDSLLSIVSKSATKLILSSSSKVALALNTLMTLTLEDAYGAAVIEVTFNLPDSSVSTAKIGDDQVTTAKIADGAITSVKLSSMGALTGQLLRWNGSSWVASDLDALTYAGTWDASVGGNPNPSAVGGEYYIVSNDGVSDPGDGNSRSWSQGDWIVYNDVTASWDQISNSSDVTSFNGRTGGIVPTTGDYTWAQIDKSTSSIGDISDVDLTTTAPSAGKILKYDGSQWVVGDDLSGGGAGSVSSTEIADGSIVDADVSGSAAISWSKIDKTGATNSDVGLGNVDNIQQMPLSYLDQTVALGTDTNKVPSQNAVKTYVDNATSGMGTVTSITGGAALSDGPYTTTGTIDVQVDDSTIEVATDALQLKDGGITNAKINASAAISWSKIDKTGATNSDVGLGNVDNIQQMPLSYLDQTVALGTDANKVPSQNAVKTYVDNQIGGVNQSQWTTNASDIYYNTGNVGIGTNSPYEDFVVTRADQNTSINISNSSSTTARNPKVIVSNFDGAGLGGYPMLIGLNYRGDSSSPSPVLAGDILASFSGAGATDTAYASAQGAGMNVIAHENYSSTVNSGLLSFYTVAPGTNGGSEKMRLTADGRLGIGTASPGNVLDVYHATTNSVANFSSGDTAVNITFEDNSTTNKPYVGAGANRLILGHVTGGEQVSILANGNVGIGTTIPSTELEVSGTITATGFNGPLTSTTASVGAGSAANPSYTFTSDGDTGFYSGTADTIEVSVGGTNIFDMTSTSITSASAGGGVLRTASSSATTPTFSFNGDEDTGWFSPSANTLAASTGGTERIRINSSGNIGVGTISPLSPMHIEDAQTSITTVTTTPNSSLFLTRDHLAGEPNVGTYGAILGFGNNRTHLKQTAAIAVKQTTSDPDHSGLAFLTSPNSNIGTDLTEQMLLLHDGKLGLGTDTPSEHLEIQGTGDQKIEVESTDANASSMVTFKNSTQTWQSGLTLKTIYTGVDTLGYSIDYNGVSRMFIDSSGNVGINYEKPTANLHFGSGSRAASDVLDDVSEYTINLACKLQQDECKSLSFSAGFATRTSVGDSRFNNLTYHGNAHEFFANTSASNPTLVIGSGQYFDTDNTAIQMRGHTGNADEYVLKIQDSANNPLASVDNSGRMGIGTYAAKADLEVIGDTRTALAGTVAITTGSPTVTGTGTNFPATLEEGDTVEIDNVFYRVQTITNATSLELEVNAVSTASGTTLFKDRNILSLEKNDGSSAFIVRSDGKVGVGTLTPSTELEVNGTITATAFNGPVASSNVSADGGTAAAPGYAFSGDAHTGFFSSADDTIEVTVGGSNIFDMSSAGIASSTAGGAVITTSNGTASTPTFSFSGDEDTGWFSPTADTLAAATAGSERIRIDSTGDVGIGTANPNAELHINKASDSQAILRLESNRSAAGASTSVIDFLASSSPAPLNKKHFQIMNVNGLTENRFTVGSNSDDMSVFTPHMSISHSGNVGIGTNSPSELLHANKTNVGGKTAIKVENPDATAGSNAEFNATSGTTYVVNQAHGNGYGYTISNAANGYTVGTYASAPLIFSTNSTEVGRFKPSGDFIVGSGSVGIGTSTPSTDLEIEGAAAKALIDSTSGNASLDINSIVGERSLISFKKGASNRWLIEANNNTESGSDAGSNFAINSYSDAGAFTGTPLFIKRDTGNVGIGITAPTEALHVSGNALAAAYLYTSDRRFKRNIQRIPASLDKVDKLRGVTFDWRTEEFPERRFPQERTMGFIAQEVEEVAPELVKTSNDGYKSVQYGNITALLVEAIKEVRNKLGELFSNDEELERKVASLEEENEKLRSDMEELKKTMLEIQRNQEKQRKRDVR